MAAAAEIPVTITVAGVRYEAEGKLQLDGRYLDGEAKLGERVFYFDGSLQDRRLTVHVSTSPKPGGYPSCWIEGSGPAPGGKVVIVLSADWKCAGGAASIELELPPAP